MAKKGPLNQHLVRKLQQAEHIVWGKGVCVACYYRLEDDLFHPVVLDGEGNLIHRGEPKACAKEACTAPALQEIVDARWEQLKAAKKSAEPVIEIVE